MRPRSLRAKINIVFVFGVILLLVLFGVMYQRNQSRSLEEIAMQERANIHYLYLYFLTTGKVDTSYLASQNIRVVKGGDRDIAIHSHFADQNGTKYFAVITVKLKRYILISNDRFKLVLENLNKPRFPFEATVGLVGSLLLLGFLYWWVVRSIRPLATLKRTIEKFSDGDLDITCRSDKGDEIAEVANAFDTAVKKIRDLLHARQLLLRAIMHELKTPIAKGRLMSEMVQDDRQKQRFHLIFQRLNLLIDEFAKVEQVASKNFKPLFKHYKISDIVEGSIDILMLDNPQKHIETRLIHDRTIAADYELLTLAIKNLIDNGIKYSQTKRVVILINDRQIIIHNHGEALSQPLEHYFEPFHTSTGGLGLGLYIVKSILDIHKMELTYAFDKGENRFTISAGTED